MRQTPARPERKIARDFAGRSRALPDDASAWRMLANPPDPAPLLLLGLIPDEPAKLPFIAAAESASLPVYSLQSPGVAAFSGPLPSGWHEISASEALALAKTARIYVYQPCVAIEPAFWLPLLAKCERAAFCNARQGATHPPLPLKMAQRMAWLPGTANDLLHQELGAAFMQAGCKKIVTSAPASPDLSALLDCWEGELPAFALSVNFRGLDAEGRIFSLCQELGVPLAIWLVDNPWNLLSGITLPWWQKANLFVTDASFLPTLQQYGCAHARFCPLAASWHMLQAPAQKPSQKALFVGRAGFAGQRSFFSGVKLPAQLVAEAEKLPFNAPDWHWWNEKIAAQLWPGLAMRQISCGADLFSGRKRAAWLKANLECLEIVGDASWQNLLPQAAILPPVDYYGTLPLLYNAALATLNVTSLLLPQSLSQRHFDVWAAGGFLLSDATPGLSIFPQELVSPMRLASPEELPGKLAWLREKPDEARELRQAWREEITRQHLYSHRLEFLAASCGVAL